TATHSAGEHLNGTLYADRHGQPYREHTHVQLSAGPRHRPPHQPHALQDRPHHGRRARRADRRALGRAAGRAARAAHRRGGLTVQEALSASGIDAREARLLLAEAAGFSQASVLAHPERELPSDVERRFLQFTLRRGIGEPVAYIVGDKGFSGLSLTVNPAVL